LDTEAVRNSDLDRRYNPYGRQLGDGQLRLIQGKWPSVHPIRGPRQPSERTLRCDEIVQTVHAWILNVAPRQIAVAPT